jgi:hypothetical protein
MSKPYKDKHGHINYFKNGCLHRVIGPALLARDWHFWYYNGLPHNLKGPSFVAYSGIRTFHLWGEAAATEAQFYEDKGWRRRCALLSIERHK